MTLTSCFQINEFRKSRSAPSFQCAVGISVSYDRMVAALQEQRDFVPPTTTDVLVCTLGHRMFLKEKLSLVKDLWSVGLCADIAHDTTWVKHHIKTPMYDVMQNWFL